MVSQTVKVINEQGLHMRPAGVFAKEMTKFKCNITIDIAGNQRKERYADHCSMY